MYAFWIAAFTMIIGNMLALPQKNIKRLLAYSGIAHIGYILLGLATGTLLGLEMSVFYFVSYLFANMGASVEVVNRSDGNDKLTFKTFSSFTLLFCTIIFYFHLEEFLLVVGFGRSHIFLQQPAGYLTSHSGHSMIRWPLSKHRRKIQDEGDKLTHLYQH
jgi:NADH-quinone oxidoreductase subunit N